MTATRRRAAAPTALRHPTRPDEILAAACRAIVERGFNDTRVGDIADAAGTSTGTIHYYFASKHEVLVAALRWATDRLFGRLEAAAGRDATARLAALLDLAIPYPRPQARRDEYVLWMEVWALVLRSPQHLPALEDLSERWRAMFFDVVRAGTAQAAFSPVSAADEVAERLIALVDGLGFETVVGYRWSTPERMRTLLVSFAAEQLAIDRATLDELMAR
ncbi:MAG: TetR/AcrR family transcriptional regulator [Solirubrobacteraceae bacterium]